MKEHLDECTSRLALSLARCRSIKKSALRSLNSVRYLAERPEWRDQLSNLLVPLCQATKEVLLLGSLSAEDSSKALAEWIENTPSEQLSDERIKQWENDLDSLATALFKLLNYLSRHYRLNDRSAITPPEIPELTLLEMKELKDLNAKLLFAQMALGEAEMQAVGPRVNLDPTMICNFRCVTCPQGVSQDFEQSVLPKEVIEKALPAFVFARQLELFGGGEPTLAPQLEALCDATSRYGVWTELLTNGSMLSRRTIPYEKLNAINVSWDGAKASTLERIRRGASFDDLIVNVQELRSRAPKLQLGFNVTLNRANLDEATEIVQLAANLGLDKVNFTRIYGHYDHLQALLLTSQDIPRLREEMKSASDLGRSLGIVVTSAVHEDALPDMPSSVEKEQLLSALEVIPTPRPIVIASYDELLNRFTQLSSIALPFAVSESVRALLPLISPSRTLIFDSDRLRKLVDEKIALLRKRPDAELVIPHCMSPWLHTFISASGGIRPCCIITENMADLSTPGSYLDHLNSTQLVQIRLGTAGKAPLHYACKECTFIERYIHAEELFDFLEDIGKDISKIPLPPNYNPSDALKARLAGSTKPRILGTTELRELPPSTPTDFYDLREQHVFRRGLGDTVHAIRTSSGHWFREAALFREPSEKPFCIASTPSTTVVPLDDATLNKEASLLANALREKPARLSPTAVIDPIVQVNNYGIVSVAATVLNTTQTWLFGWGSRSDTCDTLGLRFIHPDGTFTAEARIQMQFECLPPGGSRRLHGAFSVADLRLKAGQYRVDFDIVREGVGWSRDQGAGSWTIIHVPDELQSLPLEYSRFPTEKRLLCLTFDGSLGHVHTEELLSVLREVNVPATMFITGRYIARFPALVKEMAEDGHEIGNHTYSHPILCNYGNDLPRSEITREQLVGQLHRTEEEAERRLAHKMLRLWRAPYGARNSTILSWGLEADYRHIAWNFDGQDYMLGAMDKQGKYTTEHMIARFEKHLDSPESRGSILRFQLSSSDLHDPIYPAIQRIVSIAWSRGFSFRTVSEML